MKNTAHSAQLALTVALVLGVGVSLGGCATQPANSGSSDSGGSGTSQTDQGATTNDDDSDDGDDVKIPDWVTAGFPIYPDSEAYTVTETGGDQIIGFTVPSGDEQAIYEWFVDQYSQNGWATGSLDDEHSSLIATNSDGRSASVNVTDASYVITASQG